MAERDIADLPAHKVFLGAHAIDAAGDVVDVSLHIARLKRAMVRAARDVFLLADSSKWGVGGVAKVLPLAQVHTVVTDDGLSAEARREIEVAGVRLIVA